MTKSKRFDEVARVEALARYNILDTAPDATIDSITQAIAQICDTPIALVSLVDPTRQWFKSKVGLDVSETPREHSFCTHAIKEPDELMVVEDAKYDARFVDNPLVTGDPHIRFYAGQPLVTSEGHALGTLCVIDRKPRTLDAMQTSALAHLGDVLVSLLEANKNSISTAINFAVEQALQHGIVITDPTQADNPVIYCNLAFEALTGYTEKELVGKNLRLLQGKATDPIAVAQLRKAIAQRQEVTVELRNYRKNGDEFWTEVSVSPVHDGQGNTTHFIGIQKDVSDRFLGEAELARSKAFLESAPDAMVVSNLEGEIVMANTETVRLFGYTRRELKALNIDRLIAEDFRKKYRTFHADFNKQQPLFAPSTELTVLGLSKSGDELPIDVRLNPIQTDDGTLVSASMRDVSARVKAEIQLTEAKELAERANRVKSRFLAAASHDLRQPLQSVGMYMSLLQMQEGLAPEAHDLCLDASKSLGVMRRLLDTLLDISQLDSGSIVAEKRDVIIADILANVIASSQPQAADKGLVLECQCDEQVINTDAGLLERIIENFISNAIRYTEHGHIRVVGQRQENDFKISVVDSGIGISDQDVDQIFDEYYQIDNQERDREKGLGLGLSIVKRIALLLDHPLQVSSEFGVGSSFSVTVPLGTTKPSSVVTAKLVESAEVTSPCILLVDDDSAVLISTARLLTVLNMEVHTASSGDEALAMLSSGLQPDFLISDFRLPSYDGVELVQRVRNAVAWILPVVIMTGDTSSPRLTNLQLPDCTVLNKPIAPTTLLSLIENRSFNTARV